MALCRCDEEAFREQSRDDFSTLTLLKASKPSRIAARQLTRQQCLPPNRECACQRAPHRPNRLRSASGVPVARGSTPYSEPGLGRLAGSNRQIRQAGPASGPCYSDVRRVRITQRGCGQLMRVSAEFLKMRAIVEAPACQSVPAPPNVLRTLCAFMGEAISSAKAALHSSETAEDLAYWAEVCAILATDDRYSFRPDES